MRNTLAGCTAVVAATVFAFGTLHSDEVEVPVKQLPKKVTEAVAKKYPKAEIVKASKEDEDDEVMYEVTIKENGKQIDVTVDDDGDIESVEKEVDLKDLPKVVVEAIEKQFPKSVRKSAEAVYEVEDGMEELEYYEVQLQTADNQEIEVKVKENGTIVEDDEDEDDDAFTTDFSADKEGLVSTGRNPYFILEPGYQMTFEGGDEKVVITVLQDTKLVDGVECRVVEERETKKGKLVEVSRNYFAISKRTNSVYYFGEDVEEYQDGKVTGQSGSWLSGKDGATFGLMMPGVPLIGGRFYQEMAPKKAMDRAEIVELGISVKTPAGEFKNCLKIEETTPLEPKSKEYKLFAPGVGLVQDGDAKLVKYGPVELPKK